MSIIDPDSIGPEITVDSFADSLEIQLDIFKYIVRSRNKTGTLSYNDWLQQFSEVIEGED